MRWLVLMLPGCSGACAWLRLLLTLLRGESQALSLFTRIAPTSNSEQLAVALTVAVATAGAVTESVAVAVMWLWWLRCCAACLL